MAEQASGGIFGSLRRLGASFLAVVRLRVELFTLELEQEKHWLATTLLYGFAAVFFGITTIVLAIFTVLEFCPAPALPWVLLGFCLLFLGLAIWAGLRVRQQVTQSGAAFSGTLEELKKDLERIKGNSD